MNLFNKIIKKIIIMAAMPILALQASAENTSPAYNFLEIPTSAHGYALGGMTTALIAPDVTLVDMNPALLGPEIGKQVAFNYMNYMNGGNFAGVRYGMGAGERGAWSIGVRYLNYGSVMGYEPDGSETGKFSMSDVAFEGSYSHDFTDYLRGGIMLKMIYSSYEQYSAFAMGVDLGMNYYNPDRDLSLSLVLANMGGQLKRFDNNHARLPFDIRLGYMQTLGDSPFQLTINANHLNKWKLPYYVHDKNDADKQNVLKSNFTSNLFRHLIFGLQYTPSEKFYIALGYNYKMRTDMSVYNRNILSGFTIGAGFNVRSFGVDVTYAMPHKSASALLLNLSYTLAELL